MVQLPEPIPQNTPAKKAGFETISDIGKERIRRVIKKLEGEKKGKLDLTDRDTPEDLGFKVFKLSESNYRSWKGVEDRDGEKYADEMALFTDPLVPGWEPINVIYEVALREGYSLTCTVEELKDVKGNRMYLVTDPDKEQSFRICLDDTLKAGVIKALNLDKEDIFICRDTALTDELAANLALQCNLKTI